MISSHSDFISLIMDEEGHYTEQKLLLLELLTVLTELHPKLCQSGHIPLLLASYQATLSRTDQRILRLLHTYEKNGVALSSFKYGFSCAMLTKRLIHLAFHADLICGDPQPPLIILYNADLPCVCLCSRKPTKWLVCWKVTNCFKRPITSPLI